MPNKNSSTSNLDDIINLVNNLPKETKKELKSKGFDINNEQHLRDFAQTIHNENTYQKLSLDDLDNVSGGMTPWEYTCESQGFNVPAGNINPYAGKTSEEVHKMIFKK